MTDTNTTAAGAIPSPLSKLLADIVAGFNALKNNVELVASGQAIHPTNTDTLLASIAALEAHIESDDGRFTADEGAEANLAQRVTTIEERLDAYDAAAGESDLDLGEDAGEAGGEVQTDEKAAADEPPPAS